MFSQVSVSQSVHRGMGISGTRSFPGRWVCPGGGYVHFDGYVHGKGMSIGVGMSKGR